MGANELTLSRWEREDSTHEMATRDGAGAAADLVRRYAGYDEVSERQTRREVANTGVSLILAFGDPLGVAYAESDVPSWLGAFVVGTHTRPTMTTLSGHQRGVQVDLTPSGAWSLLGGRVDGLTDRLVPVDAVLGRRGQEMVERLAALPCWAARFQMLDVLIGATRDSGLRLDPAVHWLVRQLAAAPGDVRVEPLMDETGWSRRHLTKRFHQQVGVSPKTYARLVRFERAVGLLGPRARGTSLGSVALAAGYYDQAHFAREFRSLAGCTPTEFLRESAPSPAVSFVQDPVGQAP